MTSIGVLSRRVPVRPLSTHPPVGNPCRCGRCGDWRRATPPSVIPQTTETEMLFYDEGAVDFSPGLGDNELDTRDYHACPFAAPARYLPALFCFCYSSFERPGVGCLCPEAAADGG